MKKIAPAFSDTKGTLEKTMDMQTYTVEQLTEILHMKPRAIRRLIREDWLRGARVGKRWLVSAVSLKEFLEAPDVPPTDLYDREKQERAC